MKGSKPANRREMGRRRKIRKFWADHPERREAQSTTQKRLKADPEWRKAKSKEMKQFWADHLERREAQSKTMKGIMRAPERRKAQSKNMERLRADPKFEPLRLAGIRRAE